MDTYKDGERGLVFAIIEQAFCDAISRDYRNDPQSARRFIDDRNWLFCAYCHMVDFDPEFVAKRLQRSIMEHDKLMIERYGLDFVVRAPIKKYKKRKKHVKKNKSAQRATPTAKH